MCGSRQKALQDICTCTSDDEEQVPAVLSSVNGEHETPASILSLHVVPLIWLRRASLFVCRILSLRFTPFLWHWPREIKRISDLNYHQSFRGLKLPPYECVYWLSLSKPAPKWSYVNICNVFLSAPPPPPLRSLPSLHPSSSNNLIT